MAPGDPSQPGSCTYYPGQRGQTHHVLHSSVSAPESPRSKQRSQGREWAVEAGWALITPAACTARAGRRAGYRFPIWRVLPRLPAPRVEVVLKARKVAVLQGVIAFSVISATRHQNHCSSVPAGGDKAHASLNWPSRSSQRTGVLVFLPPYYSAVAMIQRNCRTQEFWQERARLRALCKLINISHLGILPLYYFQILLHLFPLCPQHENKYSIYLSIFIWGKTIVKKLSATRNR